MQYNITISIISFQEEISTLLMKHNVKNNHMKYKVHELKAKSFTNFNAEQLEEVISLYASEGYEYHNHISVGQNAYHLLIFKKNQ